MKRAVLHDRCASRRCSRGRDSRSATRSYATRRARSSACLVGRSRRRPGARCKRFTVRAAKERAAEAHGECGKAEDRGSGEERTARVAPAIARCSTGTDRRGQTARAAVAGRALIRQLHRRRAPAIAGSRALLWDRRLEREIKFASLFSTRQRACEHSLREPYCRALDAERKKRRGADDQPVDGSGIRRLSQIFGAVARFRRQEQQRPLRHDPISIAGALCRRPLCRRRI